MRPIDKTKGFTFIGKKNIARVVPVLGALVDPVTVLFVITFVIVYAVNLQSLLETWVHILNEGVYIMPTLTNGYASATIACISLVFGVGATAHHISPYIKKRMAPSAVLGGCFLLKTTTASSLSFAHKVIYAHAYRLASAIALALSHVAVSTLYLVRGEDNEATESLTRCDKWRRPINKFFHRNPLVYKF